MAPSASVALVTDLYPLSDTCTICECEFSLDDEGGASGELQRKGAVGHLGILLVVFCPTCHAGLYDMYHNWYSKDDDGQISEGI